MIFWWFVLMSFNYFQAFSWGRPVKSDKLPRKCIVFAVEMAKLLKCKAIVCLMSLLYLPDHWGQGSVGLRGSTHSCWPRWESFRSGSAALLGEENQVFFKIQSRSLRWEALLLSGLYWTHSPACSSGFFAYKVLVSWPTWEHHWGSKDRTKWILLTPPGSLSTAPPASIAALDSKQHLLKIARFSWTFHWYIWFSFWIRLSNLIKLKSFESNHKFLIANLSKFPTHAVYLVPLTWPHSFFLFCLH